MTAAIPLIIGIADFTWQAGDLTFTGIALGSIAALLVYHGMRLLGLRTTRPAPTAMIPPMPELRSIAALLVYHGMRLLGFNQARERSDAADPAAEHR